MATKTDVRAILKSPKLTGREAARLVIQHLVDNDHRRGKLLTEPQIERLKRAVANRPQEEVDEYNALMETYRIAEYTLKEAHILSLQIGVRLKDMTSRLDRYVLAWVLRLEQHKRPTIVTAKQFEDLKARARTRKLQELHCLNEVLCRRASETIEPGSWREYADLPDQKFDQLFDQVSQEIEGLIEEGKLQPVELQFRADDDRLRRVHPTPLPGGETVHWWPEGEHCWSSNTPEEELDRQLRTYVSGEQLYQAGLPEWVRAVDTYKHDLESEVQGLPEAECGPCVAVIQEPVEWPVELDERGYYQTRDLVELSGVPAIEELSEDAGVDPKRWFREQHTTIRKDIRFFLAYLPVMETLSDLIGVKLHEDLEAYMEVIEVMASGYAARINLPVLKPVEAGLRDLWEPKWLARKPELPAFTIEDLKPDPKRVEHLKQRMGLYLGSEWLDHCLKWLDDENELIDQEEDQEPEEVAQDGEGN